MSFNYNLRNFIKPNYYLKQNQKSINQTGEENNKINKENNNQQQSYQAPSGFDAKEYINNYALNIEQTVKQGIQFKKAKKQAEEELYKKIPETIQNDTEKHSYSLTFTVGEKVYKLTFVPIYVKQDDGTYVVQKDDKGNISLISTVEETDETSDVFTIGNVTEDEIINNMSKKMVNTITNFLSK